MSQLTQSATKCHIPVKSILSQLSGCGEHGRPSRRRSTRWLRVSKKVNYQGNSFAIEELVEVEKPKPKVN